jgi:hypothetical protein
LYKKSQDQIFPIRKPLFPLDYFPINNYQNVLT